MPLTRSGRLPDALRPDKAPDDRDSGRGAPIRDSRASGFVEAENAAFVLMELVVQNVLHVI